VPELTKSTRDLIVCCEGEGHRVRLRGGVRFISRARCPKCAAPVDPRRWRRVACFLTNLARPATDHPLDRATWVAAALVFAGTVVGVLSFRAGADLWWPATVMLFGPRWVVLLPVLPVVLLATIRDRALLVPLTVVLLSLLGPLLGFRTGIRGLFVMERESDLVVATLNAQSGRAFTYGLAPLMDLLGADVLMVQECGGALRDSIRRTTEWHTASNSTLCVVSRFPITERSVMDRANLRSVGGSALIATYSLDTGGADIHVTNVHLETPRDGLELIRSGQVSEGVEILRQKSILREIELRRAERWAREGHHPALVVGDFNTPPESRHFRRIWSSWTDAFGRAGFGIGGTRLNGWIRARIDYVMADDSWTVVSARTGEPVGSDHLPVVARLRLRAR